VATRGRCAESTTRQHKGINDRLRADRAGNRLMRRRRGLIEDDQQVEVGDAFD